MSSSKSEAVSLAGATAHPIQKRVRRLFGAAVFFALVAALLFFIEFFSGGVAFAGLAAFYVWTGATLHRNGAGVVLHNLAFERATRGELDEAEAISGRIKASAKKRGLLAVAQGLLHALIAMQRGRFEEGITQATRTIEAKGFLVGKERYVVAALGIRALLYASLGREAEAQKDIARAEGSEAIHPTAWARCTLARAILASKDDARREELISLLRQGRRSVESLTPRERVLFRALEQLVRVDARSAYREGASRVEHADAEGLAAWVSKIVPEAGSLVEENPAAVSERSAQAALPSPHRPFRLQDSARANMDRARKGPEKKASGKKRILLGVLVWLGLAGAASAYTSLKLSVDHPDEARRADPSALEDDAQTSRNLALLPVGVFVLIAGIATVRIRRHARAAASMISATMLRARGKDVEYMNAMKTFTASPLPMVAAEARLNIATAYEESGRFEAALAEIDAALGVLWQAEALRSAAHDILLPEIVASRAFLLAATGNTLEAEQEYADLMRDYPSYPFRTRASIRIRVMLALRAGDESNARRIAQERTLDLPLSLRDELLYGLLDLAAHSNPSRTELSRLSEEFAHAPNLVAWVDRVAPGLRARALGGAGVRVAEKARVAEPLPGHVVEDESEFATPLASERGAV